jgi:hypothetical protein
MPEQPAKCAARFLLATVDMDQDRGKTSRYVLAAAMAVACSVPTVLAQGPAPVSLYSVVPGEPTGVEGASAAAQAVPAAVDRTKAPQRSEWIFAPLPVINPTIDNGLALAVGYVYRLDRHDASTPPSATALGGFKTSNGSWGAAVYQSLYLAHDAVRALVILGYGDVNYSYYGVGQSAGANGVSIELNQTGPVGLFEGLFRVRPRLFVGARYVAFKMTVTSESIAVPNGPTVPATDSDLRTASLGPRVDYDSRDSTFYPRQGLYVQGIVSFYDDAFGGRRTYRAYQGSVDRYRSLGARHVLAWHVGACGVEGSVPFYDLCMLGKSQDLRGYPVGQYRDRAMVAAQVEWRSELWWRLGAVAFLGAGGVAPDFGAFNWKETLPGGGAGVRFTLASRNHVNLRADYAWGKNSTAVYVGVVEAF